MDDKKKVPARVSKAAAALGRLGGLVKSEARAKASRENGRLGGRPPAKAELLVWVKTADDKRHEASKLVTVTVPQRVALQLARQVADGEAPANLLEAHPHFPALSDNESIASGHSVTVKYATGRLAVVPPHWRR